MSYQVEVQVFVDGNGLNGTNWVAVHEVWAHTTDVAATKAVGWVDNNLRIASGLKVRIWHVEGYAVGGWNLTQEEWDAMPHEPVRV